MIEQKKKMRLDELKVDSFVIASEEITGGTGFLCAFTGQLWRQIIDPPKVNQSADWACASQIYAHCDTKMDDVVVYG